MKKQFLVIASAVVLLAACHNEGSSTIGEKDDAYSRSFEHGTTSEKETHGAPTGHTAPADKTHSTPQADTLHQQENHTDTAPSQH